MSDLIRRSDAVKAMAENLSGGCETWAYLKLEKAINALPTADRPRTQTDTLIIADALEYLEQDIERHDEDRAKARELRKQILEYGTSMCRPHGEWVEVEDYNGDIHYQCDQCKEEYVLIDGTPQDNGYNFCPNCGARMEADHE